MVKRIIGVVGLVSVLAVGVLAMSGMGNETLPTSTTSVTKANAEVVTQSNGLTVEQENVKKRIEMENTPGSIKHLYIISAYSGQVILYSTVKGKVTSSGKRLTPSTVACGDGEGVYTEHQGFPLQFNGSRKNTGEVLQDDGTYGSSIEYLYWWDVKGIYHQQYVTGGMILHVADQPMQFGRVTMRVQDE